MSVGKTTGSNNVRAAARHVLVVIVLAVSFFVLNPKGAIAHLGPAISLPGVEASYDTGLAYNQSGSAYACCHSIAGSLCSSAACLEQSTTRQPSPSPVRATLAGRALVDQASWPPRLPPPIRN